ncbi:MAG TPA: ATP-binding protein [Herpetosiphonaceae bacterium]
MRWSTMQVRIALTFCVLLGTTLVGLSLVLVNVFRSSYLQTLRNGLGGQATLIAASAARMEANLVPRMPYDAMARTLQPDPATRITFVADDGTVVADTHLPITAVISAAERPEVRAALQGQPGQDSRFVSATGENMFFVAVPVSTTSSLRVVRVGVPLTTIAAAEWQAATTVLLVFLLAATVAMALAMLSARHIAAPLLTLRAMANRLAAGEVDVAMAIPREPTLADVARDFNAMASHVRRLIESREAERQRLSTVLMTVADGLLVVNAGDQIVLLNPAAERLLRLDDPMLPISLDAVPIGAALRQAVQGARHLTGTAHTADLALEAPLRLLRMTTTSLPAPDNQHVVLVLHDLTDVRQAEHVRRTVLVNISHDLRTPVTALQAMIETLQDGALEDPAAARDFLDRMDDEAQQLAALVGDVLDLARLESGGLPFDYQPVALDAILAQVRDRIALQALNQGITLTLTVPPEPLTLLMDRRRIEQALLNILNNALRFTPAGGTITLAAASTDTMATITIVDTGAGIAPAELPYIFERFYKVDQSRRHGGAGVGLSIVRAILQQHGGQAAATSSQPGGTTITLLLPRPSATPPAYEPALVPPQKESAR